MRAFFVLFGLLLLCSRAIALDHMTVLDPDTVAMSTFRSHNNRHVIVDGHLFVSYLRSLAKDETAQTWRVVRKDLATGTSVVVVEGTNATRPPCIDRDRDGNVYVVLSDWVMAKVIFYRLDMTTGQIGAFAQYQGPPGPASFKFTCAFDVARNRLVYFGNAGRLVTFDTSGEMVSDLEVVTSSAENWVQYPHIFVEPAGRIHLSWSNGHRAHPWFYTSSHYLYSDDGSEWRRSESQVVTLPVICDDRSGASKIVGQGNSGVHRVLTSFMPHKQFIYFAYAEIPFVDDSPAYFRILRRPSHATPSTTHEPACDHRPSSSRQAEFRRIRLTVSL
jgi:hypothetical protein